MPADLAPCVENRVLRLADNDLHPIVAHSALRLHGRACSAGVELHRKRDGLPVGELAVFPPLLGLARSEFRQGPCLEVVAVLVEARVDELIGEVCVADVLESVFQLDPVYGRRSASAHARVGEGSLHDPDGDVGLFDDSGGFIQSKRDRLADLLRRARAYEGPREKQDEAQLPEPFHGAHCITADYRRTGRNRAIKSFHGR